MLIEVQPRGLTDAVAPLREAAETVREVADARRAVLSPLGSTPVVQDALREFLAAWELVAVRWPRHGSPRRDVARRTAAAQSRGHGQERRGVLYAADWNYNPPAPGLDAYLRSLQSTFREAEAAAAAG